MIAITTISNGVAKESVYYEHLRYWYIDSLRVKSIVSIYKDMIKMGLYTHVKIDVNIKVNENNFHKYEINL